MDLCMVLCMGLGYDDWLFWTSMYVCVYTNKIASSMCVDCVNDYSNGNWIYKKIMLHPVVVTLSMVLLLISSLYIPSLLNLKSAWKYEIWSNKPPVV